MHEKLSTLDTAWWNFRTARTKGEILKNPERTRRTVAPVKMYLKLKIRCLFVMCLTVSSSIWGRFPSHSHARDRGPSILWLCHLPSNWLKRKDVERIQLLHKSLGPERNTLLLLLIAGLLQRRLWNAVYLCVFGEEKQVLLNNQQFLLPEDGQCNHSLISNCWKGAVVLGTRRAVFQIPKKREFELKVL